MHQNLKYIKRLRHIFAVVAWTLLGIYASFVVLLHIPAVQRFVAHEVETALSDKLGTKVSLGSVNLGLLNRAIIDDLKISDQQNHDMLECHRLSAKVELLPLLSGRISISSAQLFSLNARLSKANAEAPLNCQFVIDSLASKDTTSHTPLDLHISSLVIRNTAVSFDRLDLPYHNQGLDLNHLSFDKISSHIMLNTLTDDSLSVKIKKLSFTEKRSGFTLGNLAVCLDAGPRTAELKQFDLLTDNSDISLQGKATFDKKQLNTFAFISRHSSIGMKDVSKFVPVVRGLTNTVFIDADVTGNNNALNINTLSVRTSNKDLDISLTGKVHSSRPLNEAAKDLNSLTWNAEINRLYANSNIISTVFNALGKDAGILPRLGSIEYTASGSGTNGNGSLKGVLTTGIGQVNHSLSLNAHNLTGHITTDVLHLGNLLQTNAIGDTQLDIDVNAKMAEGKAFMPQNAELSIISPLLTAYGYPFRNTKLDVSLANDDMQAILNLADLNVNSIIDVKLSGIKDAIDGNLSKLHDIALNANINSINPHALGLTDQWQQTTFSLNADAQIANVENPLQHIEAAISNFVMNGPEKRYECNSIGIKAIEDGTRTKDVTLTSDFANIHASGRFDPSTLAQSLTNLIAKRLPTLPGIPQYRRQDNDITLSANINDMSLLRELLGIDIDAHGNIDLNASINDITQNASISLNAPHMTCFGTTLYDTRLNAFCPGDTLTINAKTARANYDGTKFVIDLNGKAANNNLNTNIRWQNGNDNSFRGSLNAIGQFFLNDKGNATAMMKVLPSEVMISDTLWNMHPSTITYNANNVHVNNFLVENGRQHISINGAATKSANDSLVVNLKDINVAYIMNLVNFHDVEFSGFASGSAVGKSLFTSPEAYADMKVSNFRFENGRLGTLNAKANWDNTLGQINVDAYCDDPGVAPDVDGFVKVDGYISLKRQYIDLDIKADNARMEFVHTYTDSFMDNINAWATGRVRIFGPLSTINMTGNAVANGSIYIIPLNTTYTLRNDHARMIPDEIIFEHDTIYDKHGHHGIVEGALHHKNLGKMTFDLNINASHLLCFDFPELNDESFCGQVVGTGSCKIKGRPGEVNFDIDAYPEKSSFLLYNASQPDALQNQEFITWRDADEVAAASETTSNDSHDITAAANESKDDDEDDDFHTNIHLNFLVHATPDATLRLLMDQRTGDYINLNGSGTLRASYYNKGGLQIYGNYLVERGDYKMTIQQVINKNFEFLPGGTLAFGGDPMNAAINLQAQYVVPSAPLSDLNIGNSFTSSTVRVNCLMNITGTAEHPVVDFDLNLPQASADIQQMITSLMDSEEARNQQVVYLLAIGRFYAANNNANLNAGSQASLAMQSFLSGTVSQQLNNLISNTIVKDNNWNFGANISPGDEGMMNAEYEGLVSGRMLNNRLLINGQFGYRDNVNATTSFIGDFDVRYLLFPNGNLQVKMYNQTSDRYFTKSNLNTQGLGIILKHDFNSFIPKKWLTKKNTK